MHIAFVNSSGQRVMIVDMEDEVKSIVDVSEQACDFIKLICDSMGWQWELVKQPRTNSRILSYTKLKEVFANEQRGDWVVRNKEPL